MDTSRAAWLRKRCCGGGRNKFKSRETSNFWLIWWRFLASAAIFDLNFQTPWRSSQFVHLNSRHPMEPDGGIDAQPVQSRRYMSKSQRACDFCRERKSACRIEGGAPCQLCSYYQRECTFNSGSSARKRRAVNDTDISVTLAPLMRPSSVESVTVLSTANRPETLSSRMPEA